MLGLLGEVERAGAAFDRCLALDPGSDLLLERRAALDTNDFAMLARSRGFFAELERRRLALTPEPPAAPASGGDDRG